MFTDSPKHLDAAKKDSDTDEIVCVKIKNATVAF